MSAKKILKEHKDLFLGLVMICGISLISIFGNTEWFRASILQVPEKFDGAVYPVEKVPNWFTWGGDNKVTKFSQISQANLVKIAKYSEAIGGKTPSEITAESSEKQAKLTYPVVYLGDYDIQNRTEGKGSHLAVDIRIPTGTPILAVANGKVVKASHSNSGFGKHIVLEVKNVPEYQNPNKKTNYFVSYSHLNEVSVKVGQIVKRGEEIGKSGNSGTSTTPHLHFQIDKKDAPWHPYWPFTAQEAYSANLNFFTAVREGLGQENAKKFTINPLRWIDDNINEDMSHLNAKAVTVNFELKGDDSFETDKSLEIEISAKDSDNKIVKDFKASSDIKLSSTSNTAKFSQILKFENGVAKVKITNPQVEEFKFEISTKDQKFSKTIKTIEAQVAQIEEETSTGEVAVETKEVATLEADTTTKEETSTGETAEEIKEEEQEEENLIVQTNEKAEIENNEETEETKEEEQEEENLIVQQETSNKEVKEENTHAAAEEETEETEEIQEELKEDVFTDVSAQHENYEAIKYLKDNGVIGGYADGSFKPEKTVSRVEAIKMIFAGLKISTEQIKELTFSDTANNAWYSPFVGAALNNGIVKGYSDGSFKPAKSVNRSEYYKILLLSAEINPSAPSENPYTDVEKDSWFGPYIGFVKDTNLVKVDGENFGPGEGVSRAEVAESLYNLINFLGK